MFWFDWICWSALSGSALSSKFYDDLHASEDHSSDRQFSSSEALQLELGQGPLCDQRANRLSRWEERVSEDATGHLIFHSLSSLLQMAPNSKYLVGHSIVRAIIPRGTILYHGRLDSDPPIQDWLAFDPEMSMLFTNSDNGTLFTYMTTRELNLVYFDGASANKIDGVADSQDILFVGKTRPIIQGPFYDPQRLVEGCVWGRNLSVDGFVRMEYDFEIMYCDFSQGLEMISALDSGIIRFPTNISQPYPALPKGWKGFSLLQTAAPAPQHAGSWHNNFPGEGRVHVDPATFVTLFDPSLNSLVDARRGKKRVDYLLTNISTIDIDRVRADVADALARPRFDQSGVDWIALSRVIMDRFSDRLPFLRYLLYNDSTVYPNATAHAAAVRKHIGISLLPYMSREGIDDFEAWLESMATSCARAFTFRLPVEKMTKQEHVLHAAVDEVLHEICRVYTSLWREAFDVERLAPLEATRRLTRWTHEIDNLITWLDWPVWMACKPACAENEFCYVPLGRHWTLRPPSGAGPKSPYCVDLATAQVINPRPTTPVPTDADDWMVMPRLV